MRVSRVDTHNINSNLQNQSSTNFAKTVPTSALKNIKDMRCMPYYRPFFTSQQNSGKLKILFAFDLPCIYTGKRMIDPRQAIKFLNNGIFSGSGVKAIETLSKYEDCMYDMEKKVFNVIMQRAKIHPNNTLKELLNEVLPYYKRELRKTQSPIFRKLYEYSYKLPEKQRLEFNLLMNETKNKLSEEPTRIEFSSQNFKYKLLKIRDDIVRTKDPKAKKAIARIIKVSKSIPDGKKPEIRKQQKHLVSDIHNIANKTTLKNNAELNNLLTTSKLQLNEEQVVIQFSRKSFLHDLGKILDTLHNENIKNKFMKEAAKLPTSNESLAAYIVKASAESSDKIGFRLIAPSLASVEHLVPRSEGGMNALENYGGATTRANSKRSSIEFSEQMKRCPETPLYCQKYIDKLIKLYKQGVFARHNINPRYIKEFKDTIYTISGGKIDLDISEFKPYQTQIPFKFY